MKILLADDHEIMRCCLSHALAQEFPNANIQQVKNGLEIEKLARIEKWDIIISDMIMPDKTGLDVLKQLRSESIKTPMLIVSIFSEDQYAKRIIKAGGNGYFLKGESQANFVIAVKTVLSGKTYLSTELIEKMACNFDEAVPKKQHELISDKELDVLKLIAAGNSVSQIALLLSLSISTISTYRQRLLKKMKFKTNAELMHYSITNHLG